jgi:small subunit ribosomal protein S7
MRGKQAPKRVVQPDTKFGNIVVSKFVNRVMKDGKKSLAERIVYNAFDIIEEKIKSGKVEELAGATNALEVFETAIKNVTPVLEVKGKRVGGANYQVPFPVRGDRRFYLAFTWILKAARARKGTTMARSLATEFIEAYAKTGEAMRTKENVHKMAEANRAFAHFARFGR